MRINFPGSKSLKQKQHHVVSDLLRAHQQDVDTIKKQIQQEAEDREAMRKEIELLRKQKSEVSEELN